MFELLFLLLPVAAGYGWYMGRRSVQQRYQDNSHRLSREYMDGLNFLLSNQKDKALTIFLDLLQDDTGTLEAHLTLGNLFRSQGEVDRAIRIHQALMESAALTFDQRLLAVQQLGRDYLAAGLYDRAETMFMQLIDEKELAIGALQQLIIIYQLTREWKKAVDAATRLVRLGRSEYKEQIAQFYCELALQSMLAEDYEKTLLLLQKAQAANQGCARASLMSGQVFMAINDYEKAIGSFRQVLEQDKSLVDEGLLFLKVCYERINREEAFKQFLMQCVDMDSGNMASLMLADIISKKSGVDAAQNYIYRALLRRPNLKGFYKLMNYQLETAEEGRAKESLMLLRNMVGEQIKAVPNYRCERCGLTVNSLYWLCPACRNWATVKPIREFEHQTHIIKQVDNDLFG